MTTKIPDRLLTGTDASCFVVVANRGDRTGEVAVFSTVSDLQESAQILGDGAAAICVPGSQIDARSLDQLTARASSKIDPTPRLFVHGANVDDAGDPARGGGTRLALAPFIWACINLHWRAFRPISLIPMALAFSPAL